MSGYWEQSTWPGHDVDFRESSDMKCRYHPYTRKQVQIRDPGLHVYIQALLAAEHCDFLVELNPDQLRHR